MCNSYYYSTEYVRMYTTYHSWDTTKANLKLPPYRKLEFMYVRGMPCSSRTSLLTFVWSSYVDTCARQISLSHKHTLSSYDTHLFTISTYTQYMFTISTPNSPPPPLPPPDIFFLLLWPRYSYPQNICPRSAHAQKSTPPATDLFSKVP